MMPSSSLCFLEDIDLALHARIKYMNNTSFGGRKVLLMLNVVEHVCNQISVYMMHTIYSGLWYPKRYVLMNIM